MSRNERIVLAVVGVFVVTAGIANYAGWPSGLAFALATVALAGLAHVVGFATEQVGELFGPAVTGVLQSTLGNLPELFVVFFALRGGETVVAQTSIIGSLFANALLVLGAVIVVGSRASEDKTMRFHKRLPVHPPPLLPVTRFIIVIVGTPHAPHAPAARHERELSSIAAVALLLVYV